MTSGPAHGIFETMCNLYRLTTPTEALARHTLERDVSAFAAPLIWRVLQGKSNS